LKKPSVQKGLKKTRLTSRWVAVTVCGLVAYLKDPTVEIPHLVTIWTELTFFLILVWQLRTGKFADWPMGSIGSVSLVLIGVLVCLVVSHPANRTAVVRVVDDGVVTPYEANLWIKAAELQAESTGWNTGRHQYYSTTDQAVSGIELLHERQDELWRRVRPLLEKWYLTEPLKAQGETFYLRDLFIVKYDASKPNQQVALESHMDGGTLSFNIPLNRPGEDFQGGGTEFPRWNNKSVQLKQGQMLIHPARMYHSGQEITNGTRYVLVGFTEGPRSFGTWTLAWPLHGMCAKHLQVHSSGVFEPPIPAEGFFWDDIVEQALRHDFLNNRTIAFMIFLLIIYLLRRWAEGKLESMKQEDIKLANEHLEAQNKSCANASEPDVGVAEPKGNSGSLQKRKPKKEKQQGRKPVGQHKDEGNKKAQ